MARLIDADKLRLAIRDDDEISGTNYARVKKHINEAPTVDAVEVVHGRWSKYPDEHEICATEFVCSVCNESYCTSELDDNQFTEMMKYCPNCGAKMDGDSDG